MSRQWDAFVRGTKEFQGIISAVSAIVVLTVGAVTYFAPMAKVNAVFAEIRLEIGAVAGSVRLISIENQISNKQAEVLAIQKEYGFDPSKYSELILKIYTDADTELKSLIKQRDKLIEKHEPASAG